MIKEIALDPYLFAQWPHHLVLRDSFGVEKGRVIAVFSKKWRGLVREEVRRLVAEGAIGPVKASTILRWLDARTACWMVTIKAGCDDSKDWHLNAAEAWRSFDAIVSSKEIESPNAIFADEDQEYVNDPRFGAEIQRTIQRRRGPIVDCVWPLLRHSKVVKLVEPHFNPHKPRFRNVLKTLLDRLHREGSEVRKIELHVRHPEDFSVHPFTIPDLRWHLSPLVRTGCSLHIHLWSQGREKMHPRYLLTDRGGIQIDHGWDEGEHESETTPIMLLTQKRWEEEMLRYSLGSADFKIDAAKDVIVID